VRSVERTLQWLVGIRLWRVEGHDNERCQLWTLRLPRWNGVAADTEVGSYT
jgi:hypothetical protein